MTIFILGERGKGDGRVYERDRTVEIGVDEIDRMVDERDGESQKKACRI